MSGKIFVSGATGNIGRALIPLLLDQGEVVVAGSPSGEDLAGAPGRRVDFNDVNGLTSALADIDWLFLLFPLLPGMSKFAQNAVSAAKAANVSYIVRSSVAGADADSMFSLLKVHGKIDAMLMESGIPTALIRPSGFMQNYINFYAGMIKSGALYGAVADGATSMIDVSDIASAAANLLTHPDQHAGNAYVVTGPAALSNSQAVESISAATGRVVRYVPISESASVDSMRQMGMDEWTIEQMSSLNRLIALGHAAYVNDAVRELTGRAPMTFAQFVERNRAAWQ
jgi:uncharacterized protein YbjT (DUF2867 family)